MTANNQEPPVNHPCIAAGFKTCCILMASDEFTSHTTGVALKMNFATSCKSSNIIFLINCRRCGQQYVGKTGQPLLCKVHNHCFNIVHRRTEQFPVAKHFISDERTLEDMTVVAIDQIHIQDPCLCRIQ